MLQIDMHADEQSGEISMIYIVGDTHGDFSRFKEECFPQQKDMTKDDYVIIFTTLFITGNHENYDMLDTYLVEKWHGGKKQFIQKSLLYLMHGQICEIGRQTFFIGGAVSYDIYNGVLDMCDPEFKEKYQKLCCERKLFRINHLSWWEQELPTNSEISAAINIFTAQGKKMDYVVTHCASTTMQKKI